MNIPNVTIKSIHEILMELMYKVDETTKRNLQLQKQQIENLAEKQASFKEILHKALHNSKESELAPHPQI